MCIRDRVEAVDEQLGDDYAKFAGLTAEEDLKEPLHRSLRKRIPWLVVMFGLGLVVSTVIGQFQPIIAKLSIIVSFQSLVLDMAGNGGTQSLAVTIRVISDERLTGKQSARLIFKELRVGVTNGLVLGSASCGLVGLFLYLTGQSVETAGILGLTPAGAAFVISACIGGALMIAMTLSSLFGTLIPLFFKKIKLDPAVASGPLITTINDLIAVVTYYGLAWLLFILLTI
ncbi:MAG: magnesium transporter, partial [Clostridia bacterium]|nr:magnesium transporter [Clostridia bacterium]